MNQVNDIIASELLDLDKIDQLARKNKNRLQIYWFFYHKDEPKF